QPVLAAFLAKVSTQGSAYMYRGDWARDCVRVVRAKGGRMTEQDLADYRPTWNEPWKIRYRGLDLYGPGGRDWGGLWVDLALLALENADLASLGHSAKSADALEIMVRTSRQVWLELSWLENPGILQQPSLVESHLTPAYTRELWNRVKAAL